jgi:hypothetical protein
VHIGGEANSFTEEAVAKATSVHEKRRDVYKCVQSPVCDPKPGDLGAGRLKRGESCVEDR